MFGGEPHRFAQPGVDAVANHKSIDDRFNVMQLLRREFRDLIERIGRTVDRARTNPAF